MMERFWFWVAFWLPRDLVACCFVRVFMYAAENKYEGTDCTTISCADALQRWHTNCDLCAACGGNLSQSGECHACYLSEHPALRLSPTPINSYDAHGDFTR